MCVCVRPCVRACVRPSVRACVRVSVRPSVRACVRLRACVRPGGVRPAFSVVRSGVWSVRLVVCVCASTGKRAGPSVHGLCVVVRPQVRPSVRLHAWWSNRPSVQVSVQVSVPCVVHSGASVHRGGPSVQVDQESVRCVSSVGAGAFRWCAGIRPHQVRAWGPSVLQCVRHSQAGGEVRPSVRSCARSRCSPVRPVRPCVRAGGGPSVQRQGVRPSRAGAAGPIRACSAACVQRPVRPCASGSVRACVRACVRAGVRVGPDKLPLSKGSLGVVPLAGNG
ncbi:hypothetical protein EVAR_57101_1 [Eumeta japonica]|uniref:Uncharacterized protein n=1 Tax=Eumeta variegata TaxID=151549 RepID=A0A4C1YKD8_EUMVA|nr:hypothetical protein EVAR_57101_1 [Eumeta japonica]